MASSIGTALKNLPGRFIVDRLVRPCPGNRLRRPTLMQTSCAGAAGVLAAVLGWTIFTTITETIDRRTADDRLQAVEDAHRIQRVALHDRQNRLERELDRSNAAREGVLRALLVNRRLLSDTAERLRSAEAKLAGLRLETTALLAERRDARNRIDTLVEEITSLRLALAETSGAFSTAMTRMVAQRDLSVREADRLGARVAELEAVIDGWEDREENLLAQLEDATGTSLTSFDQLFAGVDVDLDAILSAARRDYTGRGGGPLDDADDRHSSHAPAVQEGLGERVAALTTDMERMSLMRVATDRMPFGMPARGVRRTSGFGMRRDPYRRGMRMHNGVDLAGPSGTPVIATGAGVVTFSGRERGYGIVVKIRHAFGFETVYAHLRKSRVAIGQHVVRGERIADMGSTGRSTGNHLHYEIRIDGTPVNPDKFIKVARDVL